MSPRNTAFDMGLPPFRGAVRQIIIASAAIFAVAVFLHPFFPQIVQSILGKGVLETDLVRHGEAWRLITYGFVYDAPLNFALSMLGIYFIGGAVEDRIGSAHFHGLFFGSLAVAAIVGCALFWTAGIGHHGAAGSGAAANAILMVFYLQNRNAPIMLFPIPIQIPVKWVVVGITAIEAAYFFTSSFALQFSVVLLGLLAGYLWYMLFLRRGVSLGLSERIYGMRNSYYRWKRRRAAKKFQVYMRKHDRTVYFDEYGNYKPPDDKRDDGRGGWVN
jgi:membrane associated rhomboid family serine protease